MNARELLLQIVATELPMTRRMLERVPGDLAGYTPHPRSMPLGRLSMHIAAVPRTVAMCLSTPSLDMANAPKDDLTFTSTEHLLSAFDANAQQAREAIAKATDEALSERWQIRKADTVLVDQPRAHVLEHVFLGHMIHHRAQLGVYLRLNNIPIPGLYGASADESGI